MYLPSDYQQRRRRQVVPPPPELPSSAASHHHQGMTQPHTWVDLPMLVGGTRPHRSSTGVYPR